jgi:hypothetical protein
VGVARLLKRHAHWRKEKTAINGFIDIAQLPDSWSAHDSSHGCIKMKKKIQMFLRNRSTGSLTRLIPVRSVHPSDRLQNSTLRISQRSLAGSAEAACRCLYRRRHFSGQAGLIGLSPVVRLQHLEPVWFQLFSLGY